MASLSKKEVKLIETLINLKQDDTKQALSEFLSSFYDNVVETPDYIYAEGNIPIALCAHMDTVWEDYKGQKKHMYYDRYKECMWCPEGAGFDDKVGIFLIIKIITSGLKPCIILSCNEEIGGLGASEIAKLDCPFKELKYCIELDRMGANDCVFYSCANKEFIDYVETFGFKFNYGSFSDISRFCPTWGIAGVNLSVGYVDEHTTNERLYVKAMLRTLSRVKKMLTADTIPFFVYIQGAGIGSFSKYYNTFYNYPLDDDDDDYSWYYSYCYPSARHSIKCDCCGAEKSEDMVFPVIKKDKSIEYRCYNCLDENIGWCDYCKQPFELEPDQIEYICPKCKEEVLSINVND